MTNGKHYPRTFEVISENFERLRVHGGWIVHHSTEVISGSETTVHSECMVFVPDENDDWMLESK